jgi:hypothetical protein
MSTKRFFVLFFFLSSGFWLLASGCAKQHWYNPSGNQTTFNLDARECSLLADKLSRQNSHTGQTISPEDYSRNYHQCLQAKGWSRTPPASPSNASHTADQPVSPPLAIHSEILGRQQIEGLGQQFMLPPGFQLLQQNQTETGSLVSSKFLYEFENKTFVNIIFQQNKKTSFQQIPYPVAKQYHLYSSGKGEVAGNQLNWTSFFGQAQQQWIMGLGAFYTIDKKRRIIIVITQQLASPTEPPPNNLKLTPAQHQAMETFIQNWIAGDVAIAQ